MSSIYRLALRNIFHLARFHEIQWKRYCLRFLEKEAFFHNWLLMQLTTVSSTPLKCTLKSRYDTWTRELKRFEWYAQPCTLFFGFLIKAFAWNVLPSRDAVDNQFQHTLDRHTKILIKKLNSRARELWNDMLYLVYCFFALDQSGTIALNF